jgi:hypothetical protein
MALVISFAIGLYAGRGWAPERHAGIEPFTFWQALRAPDLIALPAR